MADAMQSRQPFVMEVAAAASLDDCLATGGSPALMLVQGGAGGVGTLLPEEAEVVD